jgi:hypothetical protein
MLTPLRQAFTGLPLHHFHGVDAEWVGAKEDDEPLPIREVRVSRRGRHLAALGPSP